MKMQKYFAFPKLDQTWLEDDEKSAIWLKELAVFEIELEKIISSCPDVSKYRWLPTLDACVYTIRDGKYYAAFAKESLPKGFTYEEDFLVIDAPHTELQPLSYSIHRVYRDIFGY